MSVEEELRAALTLLEQRAPQMTPDPLLARYADARQRPRRWLPPLLAATLVLGLIAVIAVATRHTARHSPAGIQGSTATTTANPNATMCLEQARYRPGADTTLVPGSPTSVTICQYQVGHHSRSTTTDTGRLVAALNALPTSPSPANGGCRARFPGALPARGTYSLAFHYANGPDVVVNVLPECRPSINNSTSLQADDAATIVTILAQLVPSRQNSQYRALAINTSCVGGQCAHVRSPRALASLVHATACTSWQLNPGSHGGPNDLIRLLIPAGVVEHARSLITKLPGVQSVETIPARDFGRSPPAEPNFAPPTPLRCG